MGYADPSFQILRLHECTKKAAYVGLKKGFKHTVLSVLRIYQIPPPETPTGTLQNQYLYIVPLKGYKGFI